MVEVIPADDKTDTVLEMPRQGPEKPDSTLPEVVLPDPKTLDPIQPNIESESIPKLQVYTPSSMLLKGQWEAKIFQQVYSQTHFFDGQGKPRPQNARSSYYSGIASILFGWKPWLNFGAELWLRSTRIDAESSSPFNVLTFQSGPNSRTSISTVGPKLKFQPFAKHNGLSIQTSLLFPIGKDLEGRLGNQPYVATENLVWWTQIYYSKRLKRHWMLFAEGDIYAEFNTKSVSQGNKSTVAIPLSVFMSYFPTKHITIFAMNQVWPTGNSIWYQAGIGGKLRLTNALELELMYGRFLAGIAAAGQANAFNLGVRFVKW